MTASSNSPHRRPHRGGSGGTGSSGSKHHSHHHQRKKRARAFRPHGAPAGSWPHEHWSVCALHDPYERVNVWSHGVPGVALVALGACAALGAAPGGAPLAAFCACAAVTHLLSALTHVWPDSVPLEKLDHFGIVALILGTPATQLMAVHPHGDTSCMALCSVALLAAAAALPARARTLAFMAAAGVMVKHYWYMVNASLAFQVALYALGGAFFLKGGGHDLVDWGLTDHHFLHYCVTIACALQVRNLIALEGQRLG